MARRTKGIPEGASVVIPRLVCRDAAEIDFCVGAFGAIERLRRPGSGWEGGARDDDVRARDGHDRERVTDAHEPCSCSGWNVAGRDGRYVEDVDKTVERAVAGGARVLVPVEDQFWGDGTGSVMDPSGHVWTIATRIEETTDQERKDRWSGILNDSDGAGSRG